MIEKLYWKVRRFSIWSLFCVRKKDVPKLLEALEDLKRSMMLCGHPDYVREISAIMDEMEKTKGETYGNEIDAAQKNRAKADSVNIMPPGAASGTAFRPSPESCRAGRHMIETA
ncbi:MAG: hypothetical protein II458_04600 [Oscillospiraceae bacterium]|nr:hypothetical protein [Oscillospiraceae bacterium]